MIKAYPLIYSRTKNADFVSEFIVRPADLDVQTALKYVGNTLANLDTFDGIRYSAFSVRDYCICGGISSINKLIVDSLKEAGKLTDSSFEEAVKYINDCKGRNMKSFIGFAIRKSDAVSGKIPDLQLIDYWARYQEYIVHQWEETHTKSEEIVSPPFEIPDKIYSSLHEPRIEKVQGKDIVVDFNENPQETLEYFFDRILNKNADISFISDICYRSDWEKLVFSCSHVSDSLYKILTAPAPKLPENNNVPGRRFEARTFQNSPQQNNRPPIQIVQPEQDGQMDMEGKKKGFVSFIILGLIVVAIIAIILIVKLS